jgi:FlaG/FlaF family flagellin (archaellin)
LELMRSSYLLLICSTFFPFAAYAFNDNSAIPDRAVSLFNSFEVMCNLGALDFDHLSAQAAAMHMAVLENASEAPQTGETIQRKAWVGTLSSGPFALRTEKMSGAKGVATSCAIEGPVPDVDEFRKLVVNTLRLNGTPEHQAVDGSNTYYWDDYSGNGTTVIVRDMDRQSGHFVQVKLVKMVERSSQ